MQNKKKNAGFTLIEMMIVVVIIGIIVGIAVPMIAKDPEKARLVADKANIKSLDDAVQMYNLDTQHYPDSLQQLVTDQDIKQLPTDPWGQAYQYRLCTINGSPTPDIYDYDDQHHLITNLTPNEISACH
jgi:general secretion pathway protein G